MQPGAIFEHALRNCPILVRYFSRVSLVATRALRRWSIFFGLRCTFFGGSRSSGLGCFRATSSLGSEKGRLRPCGAEGRSRVAGARPHWSGWSAVRQPICQTRSQGCWLQHRSLADLPPHPPLHKPQHQLCRDCFLVRSRWVEVVRSGMASVHSARGDTGCVPCSLMRIQRDKPLQERGPAAASTCARNLGLPPP